MKKFSGKISGNVIGSLFNVKGTIGKKISTIFAVLTALIFVSTVISVIDAEILIRNYLGFIDGTHAATVGANVLKRDIEAAEKNILAAIARADPDKAERYITEADAEFENIRSKYAEISEIYTGDSSLISAIADSLDSAEPVKISSIQASGAVILKWRRAPFSQDILLLSNR